MVFEKFVYFSNYKIVKNTIKHNWLSTTNPKDWGTLLNCDFEFWSDTLILISHKIVFIKKTRLWRIKV